jgi:hypothetical protein
MFRQLCVFATFAVSACCTTATLAGENPGGVSRAFTLPPDTALRRIQTRCIENGGAVVDVGDSAIVCEMPLNRPERIAARILLRNPFARSPRAFLRFQVEELAADRAEVRADGWVESGATGIKRTASLTGRRFEAEMRAFLSSL